jgi:aminoglycoside phosphotransferase (APT) family kinase protein
MNGKAVKKMTITKNRQSRETISRMARKAFPDKQIASIKELTEGMCNVTYDISFQDGSESILKIAAKDRSGNTSNEVNLMEAEISAMKLASENCSFKVADIQFYDTSNTICDGHYFFMEKLKGDNFSFARKDMSEEAIAVIDTEIGKISRELSEVRNPQFGFLGEDRRFDSLFLFVKHMLENLLSDAKRKDIDIVCDERTFMDQLEKDKGAFEAVKEASLVHWDMWEGNVFVKDGHVSGIIDWERALWGEPFMDDRFRMHNRGRHFLEGFGQTSFSEVEEKRLRWYDIILYLTMMIEVYYRDFDDKGQYFWAKEMAATCLEKMGMETEE